MKSSLHRGASLIEVLVLLTALAMAAALAAPAVGHAKDANRIKGDLSNLRLLMQVAFKYADDDPDHILGPVHPQAANFIGDGYAEYGGGPGTMPYGGWNQEFDPRTRPFNRVLYGVMTSISAPGELAYFKEFQCSGEDRGWQNWPGFDTDPRETESPYFKANGSGFRMNNLAYSDGSVMGIHGRPTNRIPSPSQALSFMEGRTFQTLWTNDTWGELEHGELIGWHGKLGFFTVAYSDGHADFVDFGDATYYQHEPRYNLMDARGSWGRMDCLPDITYFEGLYLTNRASDKGKSPTRNPVERRHK